MQFDGFWTLCMNKLKKVEYLEINLQSVTKYLAVYCLRASLIDLK